MVKAISGALSLVLIIAVLRLALPEVGDLLVAIIIKILVIISQGLDHASSALPK